MNGVIQIKCGGEVLADGTASGGRVTGLVINGQQIVQEVQALRAAALFFFDRLNASNAIEFTVERQHSDAIAALDFALARRQTMAGVADLTITLSIGGVTYTAVSQACKWAANRSTPRGVGTNTVYPVTARLFSTSTTGAPLVQLLPVLLESQINPYIIASGRTATVNSGELFVARDLQLDGELVLNGECVLIGDL